MDLMPVKLLQSGLNRSSPAGELDRAMRKPTSGQRRGTGSPSASSRPLGEPHGGSHGAKQRLALARRGSVEQARAAEADPAALAELLSNATTTSVSELTLNAAGDLSTFLGTTVMYLVMMGAMFVGFSVARRRYPLVYSKNVLHGFALGSFPVPGDSFTGWVSAAWDVNLEEVANNVGLDRAMLFRFCDRHEHHGDNRRAHGFDRGLL